MIKANDQIPMTNDQGFRIPNSAFPSHSAFRNSLGFGHWRAATLLIFFAAPLAAQAPRPAPSFQHQQREQERARVMATELVSSVLDIQIRQLEENNLEKLPIYAEIKSMRGNLDQLVEREMQGVVALLVQGQRAPEKDRERIVADARTKIRAVVIALMAERQKLYKRMHLAKIAAQLRQLIVSETKVMNATQGLPNDTPQVRERQTLTTLEDQRDVTAIHFQFVDVLTDVATWEGPIGAGASKAVRLLKTLKIDQELRRADSSLASSQYADAEKAEQASIRGWRALLEIIEETQGLIGSDRESIAKMVEGLIKQQEAVREQTRQVDPQNQQRTEQLAQQEHDIQQQLGQLSDALQEIPTTTALAEQAKAAALEAEAKLFEGATPESVQQQGQVIGALAEIEKRLEQLADETSDKTADQLAEEVKKLEQLDKALDQVRPKQAEVVSQAPANAPAAKSGEDQVSQQLQQANQAADFGPALETRLADAQDKVNQAQTSLSNAAPEMSAERSESARDAMQAIDQAAAEVKQELADARREQLAVEVGELARAAEALERAAAAEREVSDNAMAGANFDGLTAEEANSLATEQARVNEVAKNIAEGVKNTAPKTAQQLAATEPNLNAATQQLQAAKQNPGEAAKPAAGQAAKSAKQAAQQLELAAKQLREEAGKSAAELAQIATQQLQPVVAAKQAVENALAAAETRESFAEPLTPLQQALEKTRAAQIEQLRASGKKSAADAQQMVRQVAEAMRQQRAADDAARDFIHGRTNSPLRAASLEDQVGDFAGELARDASGPVAQELQAATEAAEEAAKEMLVGNPNKAAAARQMARDALNRATQAAQKAAAEASQAPAGEPDEAAQNDVSDLAKEAQSAAGNEAPDAKESLAAAQQQSKAAAKALSDKQPPVAAEAQAKTATALEKSAEQLQAAIQAAAKKQAERATNLAQEATKLANQSVNVDAGATVALEQAATAAMEAATDGEPAGDPQSDITRGLERATASLAAREQELQRDKDIAEAIAQLAKDQQAARDEIAAQASQLEQMAAKEPKPEKQEKPGEPAPPPSPEELKAAQKLAEASDKFAEAQRATGEGAAEISGQEEVANQPIRKGLETASELGPVPPPPAELANQTQPSDHPTPNSEPMPDSVAGEHPEGDGQLGTAFVPRSPEETARRIAGQEALEEAAKALAQQQPTAPQPLEGELAKSQQSQSAENSELPTESQPLPTEKTQSSKKGEAALAANQQGKNEKLDASRLEQEQTAKERDSRTESTKESTELASKKFQDEPWFAKLPPSLQKAIQAKSRRGPPRGYEERLKRYFESVE